MISFSQRVQSLPGYPLAEIPSIKRRLIEAGVDVIDLGAARALAWHREHVGPHVLDGQEVVAPAGIGRGKNQRTPG